MALFKRTRRPLPGPDAPLPEHLDAILRGAEGSVEALVRALASRRLWVAVRELPQQLHGRDLLVTEPVQVAMLSSRL
ncbi:MAG: hypothetical protein JWN31_2192, partial [Frankiales bacterium]|nr:hypothetical protein [Frankiales bacterium]